MWRDRALCGREGRSGKWGGRAVPDRNTCSRFQRPADCKANAAQALQPSAALSLCHAQQCVSQRDRSCLAGWRDSISSGRQETPSAHAHHTIRAILISAAICCHWPLLLHPLPLHPLPRCPALGHGAHAAGGARGGLYVVRRSLAPSAQWSAAALRCLLVTGQWLLRLMRCCFV